MKYEKISRRTERVLTDEIAEAEEQLAEVEKQSDISRYSEEQKWHQERWQKQSDADAKQTIWSKISDFVKSESTIPVEHSSPRLGYKTADDFMRAEADRDNEYFDKLLHEEHEAWQADLQPVIDGFLEKAQNPEKQCINVVYMKGGGMKAAYTGGQAWALNHMGITSDTVDYIFGSSSGSVVAAVYAGGQEETEKGLRLLTEKLSSPDFISPKRILSGDIIKLELAEQLMSDGEYALDEEKIRNYEGKLYISVTEQPSSDDVPDVRFLDMKNTEENPSIPSRIRSSMSIGSRVTGEVPEIDGTKYLDGDYNQLPMTEVIAKVKETLPPGMENVEINILVLPQTPFEILENIKPTDVEYNMASLAGGVASLASAQKLLLAREELRKDLEEIQEVEHVNIGIMWPPNDELTTTNIDADAAKASVLASARDTIKQFGGNQPSEIAFEKGE